jgi:survival-of-motor-neuron-related-splicing factor 30
LICIVLNFQHHHKKLKLHSVLPPTFNVEFFLCFSHMSEESPASVAELEEQVNSYREQLAEIDAALFADPTNDELAAVKSQLDDVLQLTTELLNTARQQAVVAAARAAAASFIHTNASAVAAAVVASAATSNATTSIVPLATTINQLHATPAVSSVSTSSAALAPGTVCKAIWSGDGELYDATVKQVLPSGDVVVQFAGYNDQVTLKRDAVLPANDPAAAAAASSSKKRKAAEDPYAEQPIPASLTIQPSDSAEERERKKKRVKAIKSANRQKRIEKEKNQSAQSWQKFINKKASSKAVSGFSSGKKNKKSMFATPDTIDGKVGVINSGQGITEVNDRKVRMRAPGTADAEESDSDDSNDNA